MRIEGKIAKGQFVIRNLRKLTNIDLLKTIYYCLVECHISYSIALWGATESKLNRIFVAQKKTIRCMLRLPYRTHCKDFFIDLQILTVPCIYILEISLYIKSQSLEYSNNTHNYNTRFRNNFSIQHRLAFFEKKPLYSGLKIFQKLPIAIRQVNAMCKFKSNLKRFLLQNAFYSLEEFFSFSNHWGKFS